MDISNKTLAWLLIGAIIVSILGTFTALNRIQKLGITGAATTTQGTATVNITTSQSIRFAVATIDWGTGGVNTTAGYNNCTLYTDGTSNGPGCYGFDTVSQGLVLENDGNQNVNVTIVSDKDAHSWENILC